MSKYELNFNEQVQEKLQKIFSQSRDYFNELELLQLWVNHPEIYSVEIECKWEYNDEGGYNAWTYIADLTFINDAAEQSFYKDVLGLPDDDTVYEIKGQERIDFLERIRDQVDVDLDCEEGTHHATRPDNAELELTTFLHGTYNKITDIILN
jgi:hypothetical protein